MQELKIIYEDNHIIVVEKKPNIPSQSDKTGDIDMLTIVKDYIKEKYNKPGNVYLGLVHRLDRPVRYIIDDVVKFVNREIRRGNKYGAIIMDPPSYGSGTNGEVGQF